MKYRIKQVVNERGDKFYLIQFKRYVGWKTLMNVGGPRTFWELEHVYEVLEKLKKVGPPKVTYTSA